MRCGNFQWFVALLCANVVACGNTPPANQPQAISTESDEPTPRGPTDSDEPAPSRSTSPDEPAASASGGGVAKSRRAVDEVCEKLTERAQQKCTKQVANLYAASCRRYEKTTKCETEIARALECQLKAADDSLCAHQSDHNCSEVMHQLKSCEKGTAPVEQTQAEDLTLPASWSKISDSQMGFTVAMPRGAALDTSATRRTWKAEESGISYLVADVVPPTGTLSNAAILRTITNYVGNRCQLKLKVHGQLEIKGTTVVQYDSGCTDGTEWHGMMHFWSNKAVSTGLHGPSGSKGVLEPYYYSFTVAD